MRSGIDAVETFNKTRGTFHKAVLGDFLIINMSERSSYNSFVKYTPMSYIHISVKGDHSEDRKHEGSWDSDF